MKTYFTSMMILLACSVSAFGLSMEIESAQIGYSRELNEMERDKVHGVHNFMHKELKLIDGSFINEFSSQRFGASSAQTSAFIKLLKDAKIWQVQVRFQDFGEQDSALILSQDSTQSILLTINSGREDFRLKDFVDSLPGEADAKINDDGPLEMVTTKEIIRILEYAPVIATTTFHSQKITIYLKNGKRYQGVYVAEEAGKKFSKMGVSNVVSYFLKTRPAEEVRQWSSNVELE